MIPSVQSTSGAVICGPYRYLLWREWRPDCPRLLWIMLNPSTANETEDDPTLRRCITFSRAWSYGRLEVVNLYAWRTPSPSDLACVPSPVGSENDRYIREAALRAARIIVAWGAHPLAQERARQVLALLNQPVWCLGTTRAGHPRHPLYLGRETALRPFEPVAASLPDGGQRHDEHDPASAQGHLCHQFDPAVGDTYGPRPQTD